MSTSVRSMPDHKRRVHIYDDVTEAVHAAAQCWVKLAAQAIAARGGFHVALSGGATPRALYEYLASADVAAQVAWQHVHIWFGDERTVPPQHPDSNYRMAYDALLRHVPVLSAHVHRMQGEQENAHDAARAYQAQLMAHLPLSGAPGPDGVPQFDLMLLGLGPDGHVASLFPGTPILAERVRWVAAVFVEKLNTWRISLTLPVIDNARHIMVLVAGACKADIVREVWQTQPEAGGRLRHPASRDTCRTLRLRSSLCSARYPVEMIHPAAVMDWYLDAAAAQHITGEDKP